MRMKGYGRLRGGDLCSPYNWRTHGEAGPTRVCVPSAVFADTLTDAQPPGGCKAYPFVLSWPFKFNKAGFKCVGIYPDGRLRFAVYGNRKHTNWGSFFPGNRLWQSNYFTLDGTMVEEETYADPITLPANQILWLASWYTYTELGGGSMNQLRYSSKRQIGIFGSAAPDGTEDFHCVACTLTGTPETNPMPDPYPVVNSATVTNLRITSDSLPLVFMRYV